MLIRVALRNLRRSPRRTLTVLLTVALATGALFVFDGFNVGMTNQYRESSIRARFAHGQLVTAGYREQVYEKPWEHWIRDWAALRAELLGLPGVQQVFPRVEFSALLSVGRRTVAARGQGVDGVEESKFFTTMNLQQGVTLSNEPEGILIGSGLARALDVKPGSTVTVLATTVEGTLNAFDGTVTGVFHTGAKDYDDAVFRLPIDKAQFLIDSPLVESVALGLTDLSAWESVAAAVRARRPDLETVPFDEIDKVYYKHSVDWLTAQAGVIQLIVLMIVLLGILNSVATSILERKQEIGHLRANGESPREIMSLFAIEGVAVGLLGAIVGLALGVILSMTLLQGGIEMPPPPGLTRTLRATVELRPAMAVATLIMGSVTALVGSLLAGLRVVRLPVGEALRST